VFGLSERPSTPLQLRLGSKLPSLRILSPPGERASDSFSNGKTLAGQN